MLHVFDLDKTLLKTNSSFHYARYLYRKGLLKRTQMAWVWVIFFLHQLGIFSLEDVHYRAFDILFKGRSSSDWTKPISQYLDLYLSELLRPQMVQALDSAKRQGAQVVLFSSSPSFLVEAIAERLGFDTVEASHYQVDKDGRFVKISTLLNGLGKELALKRLADRQRIPLSKVTAYSDSILDLPLLTVAGRAVCVEPDRSLKHYALKQGWEIITDGNQI